MATQLPPRLYRTQHSQSFTAYDDFGFYAQGHYSMHESSWLNGAKICKHLDWRDRSEYPSPFISLTDDKKHSENRAEMHMRQGITGIFIATIDTGNFQPGIRTIEFCDTTAYLPIWTDANTGTIIFSMQDAARCFNIDSRIVQKSEWLAINEVPTALIMDITRF